MVSGRKKGRAVFRVGLIGCLSCLLVIISSQAYTQNLGGQRFVPASSEDGVLGTEGADKRVPLSPYFSFWIHYALDPLILLDRNGDDVGAIVGDLLAADITFSINVAAGFELGFNLPFTMVREGDEEAVDGVGIDFAEGAAIGDLELRVGYRFDLSYRDGLGLYVPVLLPTAAEDDPLALGFGVKPTLAYTHGFTGVDLHLNLSVLAREEQEALDYDGGSELGLRAGLRIGLDHHWDTSVLVDLGMTTPFADAFSEAGTPFEPRVGIDHWFSENWWLTAFLGFGLSGGVGAPDFRVGLGVSYGNQPNRPRARAAEGDRDGDGYSDDQQSASEAEQRGDDRDGDGDVDEDDGDTDGDGDVDEDDDDRDRDGDVDEDDGDNDGDGDVDEDDDDRDGDGDVDEDDGDTDGDGDVDEDDRRQPGRTHGDPAHVDNCPDEPEDFDGFQDDDGCPEEDNDHDGLEDGDDDCPDEPETHDGIADEDGCPDRIRVQGTLITTFEPIRFRSDSDELLPESHETLREVSNVMEANPDMEIRVEGHTDGEGDAEYNQTLSQTRAESVRRFLIEEGGIDGDRFDAQGFGESRPVGDNNTEQGRALNRRVEFHILE